MSAVVGEQMLRSSGPATARKPRWSKAAIRSLIREKTGEEPEEGAEDRVLEIVGTDETPDRYNSILTADGWETERYERNPVFLWCHDDTSPPIGLTLKIERSEVAGRKGLSFLVLFADAETSPLADKIFRLYKGGFLNATSVGFWPHEAREIDTEDEARELNLAWPFLTSPNFPPIVYERQELLELSAVPVPGNPNALVQRAVSRGALRPEEAADAERWLGQAAGVEKTRMDARLGKLHPIEPDGVPVTWGTLTTTNVVGLPAILAASRPKAFKCRLNPQLPRSFDVAAESLQPATLMFAWASEWLGCAVKDIWLSRFTVQSARIGGFLSGLRAASEGLAIKAERNILGNGMEMPPVRETIHLNSKMSDSFLVEGAQFLEGPDGAKLIVVREPSWWGLEFTVMSATAHQASAERVVNGAWDWLRANDPLKGEAFSITGEFQKRGDATFEDVFMTERNATACRRTLDVLNAKGSSFAPRGILMLGAPGTGKTMSGRVFRDRAKATFLWVSAKDLRRVGGSSGIEMAFEYAREYAPSVIFLEDIDSWISDSCVDLLKVEMDGLAKNTGVLTILTTNHPEHLPAALIDRPGRFHDVLNFDLPDETVRGAMLRAWIAGISEEQLASAVAATAGMSGAHVRYVADFVASLVEGDGMAVGEAIERAIATMIEQRELIAGLGAWARTAPRTIVGFKIETAFGTDIPESIGSAGVLTFHEGSPVLERPAGEGDMDELTEMLKACAAACEACRDKCAYAAEKKDDASKAAAKAVCLTCAEACEKCAAMIGAPAEETPASESDGEAEMKAALEGVMRKLDQVAA